MPSAQAIQVRTEGVTPLTGARLSLPAWPDSLLKGQQSVQDLLAVARLLQVG